MPGTRTAQGPSDGRNLVKNSGALAALAYTGERSIRRQGITVPLSHL